MTPSKRTVHWVEPLGTRKIDEVVLSPSVAWPARRRPLGPVPVEPWDKRSILESDMDARDCYGSLCGPQSITLRVGMLDQEGRRGTFPPVIGGLGAVVGAIALSLKPGPRLPPAPGPSRDGWAPTPKGLTPAGPPIALMPLISINNREAGLRFLVGW